MRLDMTSLVHVTSLSKPLLVQLAFLFWLEQPNEHQQTTKATHFTQVRKVLHICMVHATQGFRGTTADAFLARTAHRTSTNHERTIANLYTVLHTYAYIHLPSTYHEVIHNTSIFSFRKVHSPLFVGAVGL
ncbi:unnamed protein product [Ectocarpus sp. 12 AP-2014]